jgi:hypothetical protein
MWIIQANKLGFPFYKTLSFQQNSQIAKKKITICKFIFTPSSWNLQMGK